MRLGWVLIVLLITSCGYKYSQDPIPAIPSIDESFRQNSVTYLDKMIREDPNNIDLYVQKLNIYKDQKWPTQAISTLNAAVALDTSNTALLTMRKDYFLTNGSYRRALADINQLISKNVDLETLYLEKAIVLYQLNRVDEAWHIISSYHFKQSDPRLLELKGDIWLLKNDSLLALRHYYLYHQQYPNNSAINRKLIELLKQTKNWNKLNEVLTTLSTRDSSYLLESALAKLNTGAANEGKAIMRELVNHGDEEALLLLSEHYFETRKYDSVIYFNNLFANQYDSINPAFINIARAYDQKGWWTRALMYYDLVLQTDSTNQQALQETQKVKGKIAYLRRLKEEQEKTPVNFILPKKKLEF